MSDVNEIRLHVVAIFGRIFPKFALAPADVAEAIGENAMVVACPWRDEQGTGPDFWDLIADERNARSLGREIAVSTRWWDEPVIPVAMARPEGQGILTAERLAQAIGTVASSSTSWGAPVCVCIHSITIKTADAQQQGLLADLAARTGAGLRGQIDSTASRGLEAAIRRNLWICRIAPLVAELLREEGFLPRHGDAVAEAVYGIMDRFHCNGFDFAMDDAHLTRDVARKIAAAILREGYWKI